MVSRINTTDNKAGYAGNSPAPHAEELAARITENRDSLCAFIYMHVRDWNETEDLFQEVSLVIMRKAASDLVIRNFRAWSREIARRTMLDYWKKKKKIPFPMDEETLQACESAWQRLDQGGTTDADRREHLQRCIETLSDDLRRLLQWRYAQDLSLRRIARQIGRTEGAVQVALSRVRMALRRCLQSIRSGITAT